MEMEYSGDSPTQKLEVYGSIKSEGLCLSVG